MTTSSHVYSVTDGKILSFEPESGWPGVLRVQVLGPNSGVRATILVKRADLVRVLEESEGQQ